MSQIKKQSKNHYFQVYLNTSINDVMIGPAIEQGQAVIRMATTMDVFCLTARDAYTVAKAARPKSTEPIGPEIKSGKENEVNNGYYYHYHRYGRDVYGTPSGPHVWYYR